MSGNQRRFERFGIFERASIVDEGGNETPVILIDVSLGGAQVLARSSFPEGTPCKLVVGIGESTTILSGAIRYCKPGEFELTAVGFKHNANSSEERVAIATLVNRIFMNPTDVPEKPAALIERWLGAHVA